MEILTMDYSLLTVRINYRLSPKSRMMNSMISLWQKSPEIFTEKNLSQILSFAGEGHLKDGSQASAEFRELLGLIQTPLLCTYAENCLTNKFDDNGFALQDIVNQIGWRLGFQSEHGLYRGKKNDIGFDGIWRSSDGHSIVVEVKTTDVYRINLDTIEGYRQKLIEAGKINKRQSSVLIVVGREDTGDLEAQIRGSRHAWDIRLISIDALTNLLKLKESLNDTKTIQQINELLKPREYTRVDKLIELIFTTSQDLQLTEIDEDEIASATQNNEDKPDKLKTVPVNFHDDCVKKLELHFKQELLRQSRISYVNKSNELALICAISKIHKQGQYNKYWFAFHPYQEAFLKEYKEAYVCFGCGDSNQTFAIPFEIFKTFTSQMWTTIKNDGNMYWHVTIHYRNGKYLLAQPVNSPIETADITMYKI